MTWFNNNGRGSGSRGGRSGFGPVGSRGGGRGLSTTDNNNSTSTSTNNNNNIDINTLDMELDNHMSNIIAKEKKINL
ncbi:hypothetical protein INT45_010182 [Circinella minor]|uniref:Uncharacterized protein n=1 Tax=Circinella minor TaxID=1195481 RepID=A0A8H7SF26_9FUNG|nr:hypothetical protein INT45_010182 [Circinella minor]